MENKKIVTRMAAIADRSEPLLAGSNGCTAESDRYWRWGDDNMLPAALALVSRRSTTHRRIINDKADYIAGKGFMFDGKDPLLGHIVACANAEGDSLRAVVERIARDQALFGNAFLEVVTDGGRTFLSLYHQDASRCRIARDSRHVILHHDWAAFSPTEARTLPLWPLMEQQQDGTLRSVIHYKSYEPMFEHYGVPPYIAGLNVAAIAYKTDKWNIARIDNSFQLSGVMMLDSIVDSEEEADRIVRAAEEKFAGSPGQVMFVLRDRTEGDNSRFIPIDTASDGDWQSLHEQATADMVIAHSWFRSLSGLDYSSGFSTERILHEYEVALNTVILAEQQRLMDPIRAMMSDILGVDCRSLQIVNRPPTRSKPMYMKVWEARKADGLDYDPEDPEQQCFLAQLAGGKAAE